MSRGYYYVAVRRIGVGKKQYREKGEYIPEAYTWKNPKLWEKYRYIKKMNGEPPEARPLSPSSMASSHEQKHTEQVDSKAEKIAEAIAVEPKSELEPESEPEVLEDFKTDEFTEESEQKDIDDTMPTLTEIRNMKKRDLRELSDKLGIESEGILRPDLIEMIREKLGSGR